MYITIWAYKIVLEALAPWRDPLLPLRGKDRKQGGTMYGW
jgi:hypothetical protein